MFADFAENFMAMPVLTEKRPKQNASGADATFAIEAMMQDRKALQAGPSHFLGQNFAKSSNIKYLSAEGKEDCLDDLMGCVYASGRRSYYDTFGRRWSHTASAVAPSHVVIIPVTPRKRRVRR